MFKLPRHTQLQTLHEDSETIVLRAVTEGGRPVIIKTTREPHPAPPLRLRLEHEHGLLRGLTIPGVIKAHGMEELGDRPALILEDFGGSSLDRLLEERRLTLEDALHVGVEVAGALAALHRAPVLHKDIKPHNILFCAETGQVKLIDLSIASPLSQEPPLAGGAAHSEGTLAYMAPEQTGRMSRAVDGRSDLYALGVTLYELLTGELPFATSDPIELLHSHLARRPTPPAQRAEGVPPIVSDIVMRLLAKAAEDRYQSAAGLQADLERCLRALRAEGRIEPFALGEHDRTGELQIAQRLYGRAREVGALLEDFEQVSRGGARLLLVLGYSGVGKTSVVREVHRPVTQRGGYFVAGKFDQFDRATPCAAIAQGMRELCRGLLAEPAEALASFRGRILEAVGKGGQLIIDLVPELEHIIGAQPSVPALGPTESQNRFHLVLQRFLGVFAAAEHPLVLFLDDLQWADAASLQLIQGVLTQMEGAHLLIIGAYRDNEVGAGHPLLAALELLRKGGGAVREIHLRPLAEPDIAELLSDTLGAEPARVAPLAALVHARTHGNPFFVNQLLLALHRDGLLRWDEGARAWRWSEPEIRARRGADDVVALMTARIGALGAEAPEILPLAACIGHRFTWRTLQTVSGRPARETAAALWEALEEGLIVPLDSEYRFLRSGEGGLPAGGEIHVSFRFLHDRVQQAAYARIAEEDRAAVHLAIGRLLRHHSAGRVGDDELFEVVSHLNLGAALIEGATERLDLARLDLRAGRRAKMATAYEAASRALTAGIAALGPGGFEADHALAFDLHFEQAECAYLLGQFEAAGSLFDVLLARSPSRLDATRVHNLRALLCTTLGDIPEVLAVGRAALALFGVELPEGEAEQDAAIGAGFAEVDAALAGRRIADLAGAPVNRDPEHAALMQLYGTLSAPAFFFSARLFALIVLHMVRLSMRSGNTAGSDYAYAVYSMILMGVRGRFREAYEFGELGVALTERVGDTSSRCMAHFMFGNALAYGKHPRLSVPYLESARQAGLECGNFTYVSFYCIQRCGLLLLLGEELGAILDEIGGLLALLQRTRDAVSRAAVIAFRQLVRSLTGRTAPGSLNDEGFDEELFARQIERAGLAPWIYCVCRLIVASLHGDHAAAIRRVEEARALEQAGIALGHYLLPERHLHACLTLAALLPGAPEADRARWSALLVEEQARLSAWAEANPEGFLHKQILVAAEVARAAGRDAEAMGLYEEAIAAARRGGFAHMAALAGERAGELQLRRGREALAAAYLEEAHDGYLRWGATAKARQLLERHARLLVRPAREPASQRITASSTRLTGSGLLDVETALRAAQAISGEIVLDRVLDQLMRIVLANAGAQRGFLLVREEERWVVAAEMSADPDRVPVGGDRAAEAVELAFAVVRYAERSREAVVLGDAATDPRFAGDPHIAARRPRSVLCLPLLHRGRLSGVLYLENNAARDAFTQGRVELLQLLSGQAAIAIENARLYADVQRAHAELGRVNEALAREVETIRAQRERLAEMSTPLIPITDRVMVMPLIGTVDEARAGEILEAALQGAARAGAAVVILDLTGIRNVDGHVVRALVTTASALRLLGAEAVLTGLRGELARLLVEQGEGLAGLVTRGTLQGGIAYALERARGAR